MRSGSAIAVGLLLGCLAAVSTLTADEAVRARARAAVGQSDVQSTLEFGNLASNERAREDRTRGAAGSFDIPLAPVAGLGTAIYYMAIAVAVILIGLTVWTVISNRRPAALAATGVSASGLRDDGDARGAEAWLRDADQLAAEGRWGEAIHALLLATIRLLSDEFGRPRASRTSRELIRQFTLQGARRTAFHDLVVASEQAVFGGRRLDEIDYAMCRERAAAVGGTAE
ncbi:MAG: DUF4129 domain-containing protein [Planctomyces sp.]|nr:DUF4129 domain-containing protein [Planctomyces sp.]